MAIRFSLRDQLARLSNHLRSMDTFDKTSHRLLGITFLVIILLMAIAGLSTFLLSLKGSEMTLVPNVDGMELSQALVKLQEKELYPRIALRFTDKPSDRGTVVDISPRPGMIVKAGRRIQVTVSRGTTSDKVESYVGQSYNDVKMLLQTQFAGTQALLTIKEPPIYVFDKSAPGTILQQKPLPETVLSAPTQLALVVSRGLEPAPLKVPALTGKSIADALSLLQISGLSAYFTMKPAAPSEVPGTVVAQNPAAQALVSANSEIQVSLASPSPSQGTVSGIFSRELPVYSYPVDISLNGQNSKGENWVIFATKRPGGIFTSPYQVPVGTQLVLKVLGREIPPRVEVRAE